MPVKTGVSIEDTNYEYLKATGNLSGALNGIISKVRTGQWVDAQAIAEGKAEQSCIYNMASTQGTDPNLTCPVKIHHPDLQKPDRLGDLLACCRQCPRRQEYLALVKHRLKYPSAFEQQQEETYTPPEDAQPKKDDITIRCDDCGAEVSLSDFAHFGTPLLAMRNGLSMHVDKAHGRKTLSAQEWPAHLSRRLTKSA